MVKGLKFPPGINTPVLSKGPAGVPEVNMVGMLQSTDKRDVATSSVAGCSIPVELGHKFRGILKAPTTVAAEI